LTGDDFGHVVREMTVMGVWPMLIHTNYAEWALLMQVNLDGMEVWDAIDPGCGSRKNNHIALGALLCGVPLEMWPLLAKKKIAQEAWEVVRSLRIGSDRVKAVNVQRLMIEFKNSTSKEGELVDEFGMRIESLAENLHTLGESITDVCMVKKMLRVLPKKFSQIAASIETLLDINSLTVEDLVSRLKPSGDRATMDSVTDQVGRLMLTEEEWLSNYRHRLNSKSSSLGGGDKSGSYNFGKQKEAIQGDKKDPVVKLTSEGTPCRKGRCRNCGIYGHWKQDCKRPRKDHEEEAHHVQADADQPVLLLTTMKAMHVEKSQRNIALVKTVDPLGHASEQR
jgi:hypothetical protein